MTTLSPSIDRADHFSDLLRTWRQRRRLSQLELALASGVSQRHVSFLEAGRANPSRSMVLLLSDTLEVPLRDRNDWLVAGGFAPLFAARTLDDPHMGQVMSAIRMMLANHEPFPAVAVDRTWDVRLANTAFERLSDIIGPDTWARVGGAGRNLLRLFFHPDGVRPQVANWAEIAPLLWRRARREAETLGGEEMKAILAELAPFQDTDLLRSADAATLLPVMPLTLAVGDVRISLFTVISTFGTAQDVTTDELRIETMFPADAATEQMFRSIAAGPGPEQPPEEQPRRGA